HRAAAAAVIGPTLDVGPDEGAIDEELPPALKQAQQIDFAVGPVEFVVLLDEQPGHPSSLRSQRIVGAHHFFFFDVELPMGGVPLLRRYDRWCVHLCAFRFQLVAAKPAAVRRNEPCRPPTASSSTDRPTCSAVSAGPPALTKVVTSTPCRSAYAATALAPKSVAGVSRGSTDTNRTPSPARSDSIAA